MRSLNESIQAYKKQLKAGDISIAYRGILDFMLKLKNRLKANYPEHSISSSLYQGYMDMSYFSFTPEFLRKKKLKIAIVFIHESVSFELWLSAANKKIQKEYHRFFIDKGFQKYKVIPQGKGIDSILEYTLSSDPNFDDTDSLMKLIEKNLLIFISEIESFLS